MMTRRYVPGARSWNITVAYLQTMERADRHAHSRLRTRSHCAVQLPTSSFPHAYTIFPIGGLWDFKCHMPKPDHSVESFRRARKNPVSKVSALLLAVV